MKKKKNAIENLNVNREFKNSVFSLLFSNPDVLRELYSAIEGVDLAPDIPIDINTLSDVLFKRQVNDISFTVGNSLVVLIEHQSTVNNNMPLRLLKYIVSVYDRITDHKKLYREKTVEIPRPRFIVLYNGEDPYPDYKKLRLCDAFMDDEWLIINENEEDDLAVNVHIYNINRGHNEELLKKSEALDGYSLFVDMINNYKKEGIDLEKAVQTIVKYCIDNNILRKFFKAHGSEVYNMIIAEYDPKEEMEALTEEAWENGLERGREEGLERVMTTARNALAEGLPTQTVQKITGLDMAVIEAMRKEQ